MTIAHLSRRARAKAQEARLQARAQSDANKAVCDALESRKGAERERMADAVLDAAITAHATIHGSLATVCRLSAKSGRLSPAINAKADKFARADEQLRTGRAA